MKKLYNIHLLTLVKKTFDFRRWHYIYIDGKKLIWWCLKYEKRDIITDYKNHEVKFKKIPFYKTIIRKNITR